MKRIIAILLIVALALAAIFTLSACGTEKGESDAERTARLQREAENAKKAAEQARKDYNDLQRDIAEYNRLMDAINNAKPAK